MLRALKETMRKTSIVHNAQKAFFYFWTCVWATSGPLWASLLSLLSLLDLCGLDAFHFWMGGHDAFHFWTCVGLVPHFWTCVGFIAFLFGPGLDAFHWTCVGFICFHFWTCVLLRGLEKNTMSGHLLSVPVRSLFL